MSRLSPAAFQQAINAFDPLLRVRWSSSVGKFAVERLGHIPETERKYLAQRKKRLAGLIPSKQGKEQEALRRVYGEVSHELEAAETRNARVIFFTEELNDSSYNALCASDITRYGGYSRYADELERREAAEEKERKRQTQNRMEDIHREAYDVLGFLQRRRSTQLEHGERDMKKLLHGRA